MESHDLQQKLKKLEEAQIQESQADSLQQETTEPVKKGLTWLDKVIELQQYPDRVRNICILAHVDHGKTTLSDSLISSNQIINSKLAGQLRYLDSREDEQQRMITMKASSISLLYAHKKKHKKGGEVQTENQQHLINLMDSPGHVDFSNEVSSALRMSDGGLVIVDVSEGVSPQTHTVIKQAWAEKVKLCLVLNKIDRLMVERGMDGSAIYQTLVQTVEQVNSIVSELIKADLLNTDDARGGGNKQAGKDFDSLLEQEEQKQLFRPDLGNVAFASGYDCWSFTLPGFIPNVAKRLGMNPRALLKFMWDQYYFDPTSKEVTKQPPSNNSKEMFVQFIMDPLVERYKKFFNEDIIQNTALVREAHTKIKDKFSKLMPMEDGVLKMVCDHLPAPCDAQRGRYKMFCPFLANPNLPKEFELLKRSIENCESGHSLEQEIPTTVYVTKMQPFSARLYDITTRATEKSQERQRLIAISRVFSGTLKVGQKVYVMGPRHQINGQKDVRETTIRHLFLLMGGSLKLVDQVPAGSIVGIGGLDDILIKTGTISTDPNCPNFTKSGTISMGLVKVAIETLNIGEMTQLKEGLIKLNKSDPSVQFFVNNRGEYILSTCGEIHLERCLTDLKDDFCPGVELNVSDPIIPFREAILNRKLTNRVIKNKQDDFEEINSSSESEEEEKEKAKDEMTVAELLVYEEKLEKYNEQLAIEKELLKKEQSLDPYLEKLLEIRLQQGDEKLMRQQTEQKGWAADYTANKQCRIKVRAVSLDPAICKWLESNLRGLRDSFEISQAQSIANINKLKIANAKNFVVNFFKILEDHNTSPKLIRYIRDSLACFGPRRLGTNILINKFNESSKSFFHAIESRIGEEILPKLDMKGEKQEKMEKEAANNLQKVQKVIEHHQTTFKELNSAMISGFDLATFSGPLMDEPMQGAIFIIEDISLAEELKEDTSNDGPFGGQIMGTVKSLCKKAFLNSDPRIVEGMYLCKMQASPETYGVVYNVIHRFRGRVIQEEVQNGTNFFLVDALIPIVEGFEFNGHIRKMSSGIAQPQLVFYGYEVNVNNDPLFLPSTAEELEEHGAGDILVDNIAKQLIERVRKQKGLIITKKIQLDGEKQRTLTKKK